MILMGVAAFGKIAARLIRAGLSPATPVAAVRWGTVPEQQVRTGTLANAGRALKGVKPPSVIVVGPVVRLRRRLKGSAPPGWAEGAKSRH